jgi:hypothetical protein
MAEENKLAALDSEQEFKNQVFANNPKLYGEMFVEEETLDEDDIHYVVPGDDKEFKKMLRDLSSYGIIG